MSSNMDWLTRARQKREEEKNKSNSTGSEDWLERARKKREEKKNANPEVVSSTLATNVNNWLKNHNTYVSDYQNRYSGRKGTYEDSYVSDSASWLDKVSKQKSNFDAEADSILAYMDQYKGYLDAKWMDDVRKTIAGARDQQKSIYDSAVSDNQWWSSFGSEDLVKQFGSAEEAYKYYQRGDGYNKKYEGKTLDEIQTALDALPEGEEKDWLAYNMTSLAKGTLSKNADWAERSKYKSTYRGGEKFNAFSGMYTDTGYDDITYDYINRDEKARKRQLVNDIASDASFLGLDTSYLKEMTDDEIAVYNYLYDPNDTTAADKYLAGLLSDLNYRQRETQQKYWSDYAKEHPVLSSGFSVLTSPLKGLSAIGQFADYAADGAVDQNAAYNKFSYAPSTIREQVSSDIATPQNGVWGEIGSWTYQLGMGMGDFLVNSALSGGSSAFSLALMGSGAMADTVISAKDRGLSDDQAMILGVVAGAAEIVTEKFSLDALFKGNMTRGAMRYILTNALTEGTEEVGSSVINLLADVLVSKDKSEWQMQVQDYINKNPGATEQQAFWKVLGDTTLSLGLDFVGGALMGGVMGTAGAGINYLTDGRSGLEVNQDAVKQYGGQTDALIQEGLGNDKKSDSYYLAQKYQKQVHGKNGKGGKALTGAQIRSLLAANQEQVTAKDMQMIQQAAEKRLAKLGQKTDVSKIAELATRYATGGKLTRAERSFLVNSEYGPQVTSEMLDPGQEYDNLLSKWENDMSGDAPVEFSRDWIENVGTRSVNRAAYDKTAYEAEQQAKAEEAVRTLVEHMKSSMEESASMTSNDQQVISQLEEQAPTKVAEDGVTIQASTGNEITPQKIVSIDNGEAMIQTDSGTISANDIAFGDENTDLLWRGTASFTGITPQSANGIIRAYLGNESVSTYLRGAAQEFQNGYYNKNSGGVYADKLTPAQREIIYGLGQKSAGENTAKAQAKATAAKKAAVSKTEKVGKVHFDRKGRTFDAVRETALTTMEQLSAALGVEFYVYESYRNAARELVYKDASGNEVHAPNGYYDPSDGSIHIDLNAGATGKGTMLFTVAHELTHFIKQWSPAKFKVLANVLVKQYSKNGATVDSLVEAQLTKAKNNKKELTWDEAFEEVVADSMESILTSGNVVQAMAEVKKQDKGLWKKICDWFKDLAAKLRAVTEAYKDYKPDSKEGKMVAEMRDVIAELEKVYTEALVEAGDNFQAAIEAEAVESLGENAKVETNAEGELLLASNERGNVQVYSERTYRDGGRDKLENALRQNGHTEAEIKQTLSYVDDALDYIKILAAGYAKNMGYTNLSDHLVADIITNVKTGKQVMSAIVNNGDYPVNIDLSLICKKRVAYMNLMSRLIRDGVFDKVNYDGAAIAEVNEILRANDFETACLGCFVESRRLQFQTWAETIVSEWNAEVEKRNPNAKEFGFAKGKMEELTDADINALTRELETADKNVQGNVNLGQGNSVTRMGRLLDALPSLQKKLTVEDLLTPEGLTALRKHDGSLFSIVKSRYGAASPKIVQDFNPYASEIAMLTFAHVKNITNNAVAGAQDYVKKVKSEYGTLKKAKGESKADFDQRKKDHAQRIQDEAMRRYLYDIGGARIQSFSDFMIENIFDYIQIFADLSAKRLPLHGYSKEIVCLRLFGMTGAKWNGSLIAHVERNMGKEYAGLLPAGTKDGIPVTVDGKEYVIGFDDYARNSATGGKSFIQSIGMKDIIALQLDPRYSPYVGNITIGVSDKQILAMLDSPLFRMVIPYHASGMLPMFAKLVGVDMYNDYTDYQNTTVRQYYDLDGNAVSELKNAKGEAVKADTSYAFNAEIQKTKDARAAANNYLNWCAQRHPVYDHGKLVGYATFNPKFSSSPYGTDFTRHENYYKLLEDFNTYDCITEASTVQGAVTMNFPSEANRLTAQQMEAYKEALRETGIFTEKDIEKYAKKADMTFKEIISAEVGNRANYAATQAPKWESTVKTVEEKLQRDYARDTAAQPKGGVKNSDRDSTGKQLSKEQQEFFKNSVVRDADGNLLPVYHSTNEEFNTFEVSNKSIYGEFYYFAVSKNWSKKFHQEERYSDPKHTKKCYLNLTKVFDLRVQPNYTAYGSGGYYGNEWIKYIEDKGVELDSRFKEMWSAPQKNEHRAFGGIPAWALIRYDGFTGFRESLIAAGYDGIVMYDIARGRLDNTVYVAFHQNQIKLTSNKKPTADTDIRYSDRASNKELSEMDDTALYIKNTDKANYIGMIFNGAKTEETRSRRTLDAFIGKDFYVTDGKYVYGSIVLGEPHKYSEEEFHKKKNQLKHRVPVGDEYDIKPGGTKWAYPIESYKKFDKPKKLSDSKEYKNSFQARQVKFSDRGATKLDQDYMDAVEHADMDTVERMVYEEAKRSGFPEKLYHGSMRFGFTKGDVSKSDDHISFFATDSMEIARTYSGDDGAKSISLGADEDIGEYVAAYEQKSEDLVDLVDRVAGRGSFGEHRKNKLEEFRLAAVKGIAEFEAVSQDFASFTDNLVSYLEKGLSVNGEDVAKIRESVDAIYDVLSEIADFDGTNIGNYQLYANTEGLYEVDAKGRHWDNIQIDYNPDDPYGLAGIANSRDIAQYAKSHGYKGIKITNVLDDGGRGDVRQKNPGTIYAFFNPQEQVKSADPVTYDDEGNVIPLSQRFNVKKDDFRHSDRDPEQEKVTRLLEKENADLKEDVAHLRELVKLQSQVTDGTKFTKTSVEAAAGNLIKSINAKGDKKELAKLLNGVYEYIANGEEITFEGIKEEAQAAVNWLTSRVQADETPAGYSYDDELFSQEVMRQVYDSYWNVSTLRTVADKYQKQINQLKYEHSKRMSALREYHKEKTAKLKKEHKEKLQRVRQEYRERMDKQYKDITERYRESRKRENARRKEAEAVKKNRAVVEKAAKVLMDMLAHPTKDAHVPTALHKPLQEFLEAIDFSSKTQYAGKSMTIRDVAYTRALAEVRAAIAGQRSAMEGKEDGTFELDIPDSFLEEIDTHIRAINSATKGLDLTTNRVYDMTSDELADLGYMLKVINKAIRDIDKLHIAGAKARVSELGQNTRLEMSKRKPVKGESGGSAMWANYTPWHAFRRMGKAAQQIFKGLMQGQAKLARTINSVIQFTKTAYTVKEAKAWDRKKHTINLDSGKTISMTPAQIMSFYCLSKREHAMGHMMGGGIRISTIKEGARKLVQKEHYTLTEQDIVKISNLLTDRQRAVAEQLQQYMQDVGGRLNNEISMARWDYMAATEEHYFPIKTDDSTRDVKDPGQEKTNLWALLNKSFTKGLTPGANNAMVVESIFDVFADHMSEVAEYNAFALPLVDAMKWFNYRERIQLDETHIKDVGVQKAIRDALGTSAVKYFVDLMTDINSSQKAGRHENLAGQILSRSKVASVGWNLRVAIQQPTAILRASMILDVPSLLKGTFRIGTKDLVSEMQKYSGIALWKSMGYYDLNVSRSVREQIKGDDSLLDKFNEFGMWLPGKMDEITWARIWAATKVKVAKEQKLTGEALLQATAELFEEIVYQTQVADSVLTRSSMMRSKSQFMKEATAFMAESTVSANILLSAFQDYEEGRTAWDKTKRGLMIGFCGYAMSSVVNAIATALMDAWRDDDEYEEYWEKFRQALLGEKSFFDGNLFSELNPLEKIVFVKDFLSLLKGYDVTPGYAELFQSAIDLVDNFKKLMNGKGSITEYGVIYQSLHVLSGVTGFGASNIAREVIGVWNNTIGKIYPNMLVHRYDTATKSKIRNAYDTNALTDLEAMQLLIDNGVAENEDEAKADVEYWKFQRNHPDIHADDQWFHTYYKKVSNSGIGIELYIQYRNKLVGVEGKEDRMAVIHTMPMTKSQKDALYLAEGWSQNTIGDAPWH